MDGASRSSDIYLEAGLRCLFMTCYVREKLGSDMRKRLMMPVVGLELSYTVHAGAVSVGRK